MREHGDDTRRPVSSRTRPARRRVVDPPRLRDRGSCHDTVESMGSIYLLRAGWNEMRNRRRAGREEGSGGWTRFHYFTLEKRQRRETGSRELYFVWVDNSRPTGARARNTTKYQRRINQARAATKLIPSRFHYRCLQQFNGIIPFIEDITSVPAEEKQREARKLTRRFVSCNNSD